jgi:hypothetical protein
MANMYCVSTRVMANNFRLICIVYTAATIISCVKFLGTPPPIIKMPVSLLAIFILVNSRKSFAESIDSGGLLVVLLLSLSY